MSRALSGVVLVPPVSRYMTIAPCSVPSSAPFATAQQLLRAHGIRHLPVVDGDRLVGIVSDRDLQLLETLAAQAADPPLLTVADAMTTPPLTVPEDRRLDDVVDVMARRRVGSAVVTRHGKITGIFTTVDALLALRELLAPATRRD